MHFYFSITPEKNKGHALYYHMKSLYSITNLYYSFAIICIIIDID